MDFSTLLGWNGDGFDCGDGEHGGRLEYAHSPYRDRFYATLWGIFMANPVWLPLADIKPEAKMMMLSLTNILARFPNRLRIDGHTDNLPIKNAKFASNWQLSTARAANVAHLLHEKGGIDGKRISVTGHASFDPALPNTTAKNRTINRRVEIVVLDE